MTLKRAITWLLVLMLSCSGATVSFAGRAAAGVPGPTVEEFLSVAEWQSIDPDVTRSFFSRGSFTSPRGCDAAGIDWWKKRRQVLTSINMTPSTSLNDQEDTHRGMSQDVVHLKTVAEAKALVRSYRHLSRSCVGNREIKDGDDIPLVAKTRRWTPPKVGDQSGGYLWCSCYRKVRYWNRTLAVRVGRTVTVLQFSYYNLGKPTRSVVLRAGRMAAAKLV
ncbi:hypothetical protein [Nocardioides sp. BYT-33-1]|uniref:hypothetical protein n=1 Tax=Nocardioides sp. BYT-33-1 TaxID=3416952 RepID=UPI003F53D16E